MTTEINKIFDDPFDCGFAWPSVPTDEMRGQHVCARIDQHDIHQCCCGVEKGEDKAR